MKEYNALGRGVVATMLDTKVVGIGGGGPGGVRGGGPGRRPGVGGGWGDNAGRQSVRGLGYLWGGAVEDKGGEEERNMGLYGMGRHIMEKALSKWESLNHAFHSIAKCFDALRTKPICPPPCGPPCRLDPPPPSPLATPIGKRRQFQ